MRWREPVSTVSKSGFAAKICDGCTSDNTTNRTMRPLSVPKAQFATLASGHQPSLRRRGGVRTRRTKFIVHVYSESPYSAILATSTILDLGIRWGHSDLDENSAFRGSKSRSSLQACVCGWAQIREVREDFVWLSHNPNSPRLVIGPQGCAVPLSPAPLRRCPIRALANRRGGRLSRPPLGAFRPHNHASSAFSYGCARFSP